MLVTRKSNNHEFVRTLLFIGGPAFNAYGLQNAKAARSYESILTTISDAALDGIKTVAGGSGSDCGLDGGSVGQLWIVDRWQRCGNGGSKHAGTPAVAANNIRILPAPNESDGDDEKLTLLGL